MYVCILNVGKISQFLVDFVQRAFQLKQKTQKQNGFEWLKIFFKFKQINTFSQDASCKMQIVDVYVCV